MKGKLTANQLKLLALATMTIDHIGVQLLPQYPLLRVIGRLAFPIYAWMIAEGCAHTKNRRRYLLQLAGLALLCQLVYFFVMGSAFQCILVTFTLSVLLICAFDRGNPLLTALALLGTAFVTAVLPRLLPGTDFGVDYGFFGVLLPVAVYLFPAKRDKLLAAGAVLALLGLSWGGVQWCGLLALLPLGLYNGQRGRWRLKWLFYAYYPLHLAVIYAVSLVF